MNKNNWKWLAYISGSFLILSIIFIILINSHISWQGNEMYTAVMPVSFALLLGVVFAISYLMLKSKK